MVLVSLERVWLSEKEFFLKAKTRKIRVCKDNSVKVRHGD